MRKKRIKAFHYGPNDPRDVLRNDDADILKASMAVMAILLKAQQPEPGILEVPCYYELLGSGKYVTQNACAYATGVIIGPGVLLTAGHILNRTPKDYSGLLGYLAHMQGISEAEGGWRIEGIEKEYYSSLFNFQGHADNIGLDRDDFALVNFNCKGHEEIISPKNWYSVVPEDTGLDVYALGFWAGRPLKHIPGKIMQVKEGAFTASIDFSRGLSGAPIFRADTHQFIGIGSGSDDKLESAITQKGTRLISASDAEGYYVVSADYIRKSKLLTEHMISSNFSTEP